MANIEWREINGYLILVQANEKLHASGVVQMHRNAFCMSIRQTTIDERAERPPDTFYCVHSFVNLELENSVDIFT